MSTISSHRNVLGSLAVVVALASGCANAANDKVSAKIDVIDHSRSALAASGITALNGFYTDCSGRSNGEAWSVAVNGSPTLANALLSVRKNDNGFELTVTDVVVGSTAYTGSPNISFATSYAASASGFNDQAGDPIAFYGNAKIDSLSFAADFTIRLIVSDDSNDTRSALRA